MLDFLAMAQENAPTVAPRTMAAIVHVESGYNPFAIGVVGGRLVRQPVTYDEAVATAKALEAGGWNFSVGLTQINRYNLPKFGITYESAFDPRTNLRVGSKILEECYLRASRNTPDQQEALRKAFSAYYSGNFTRGFKPDAGGQPSYVQKVLASAGLPPKPISVVPAIRNGAEARPQAVKASSPTSGADRQPRKVKTAPVIAGQSPVLLRTSNSAEPQKAESKSSALVF